MTRKRGAERAWWLIVLILAVLLAFVSRLYFTQNRMADYIVNAEETVRVDAAGRSFIEVEVLNKTVTDYVPGDQFHLSYHVFDDAGQMVEPNGIRSEINLKAGERRRFPLYIDPAVLADGEALIGVDAVKEGAYWFSERNNAMAMVRVRRS